MICGQVRGRGYLYDARVHLPRQGSLPYHQQQGHVPLIQLRLAQQAYRGFRIYKYNYISSTHKKKLKYRYQKKDKVYCREQDTVVDWYFCSTGAARIGFVTPVFTWSPFSAVCE